MGINSFFRETLGAIPVNDRWSWGAVDPIGHRVFLRLWQDQFEEWQGETRVQVYWKHPTTKSSGLPERLRHIEAIKSGALGFGVVCIARDPDTTGARKIGSFDEDTLLEVTGFSEDQNYIYGHIGKGSPTRDLERPPTGHSSLASDLRRIRNQRVDATTKEALVDARVGQGKFRADVLRLWGGRCAVTGTRVLEAVRASHIKPWRVCNNDERLDPANGLPLVATLDALFDAGLVAFTPLGRMILSSSPREEEWGVLGTDQGKLLRSPSVATQRYLQIHRDSVYCP